MAPPVYSRQLFWGYVTAASAWTAVYVVPSDKVLILKTVTVFQQAAGSFNVGFGITSQVTMHSFNSLAAGVSDTWATWAVFPPGQSLGFFPNGGNWAVSLHGQLLDNT